MPSPTLPAMTYPSWSGTFQQTDDWSNESVYNMFLEAIWERLLVSGDGGNQPSYPAGGGPTPLTAAPVNPPRPPKVQLYSAGPPPIPATDVQGTASAMPPPAPIAQGNMNLTYFTVAEMQYAIMDMVEEGGWTDPTFDLDGVAATSFVVPDGLVLTLQTLGDLVGVTPPPIAAGYIDYYPFNRKRFRQIFSATGNTASNQWYGNTAGTWDSVSSPAAVIGMKADLYDGGEYAVAVPGSGMTTGTVGVYKGVYIYQGGGTWAPSTTPGDQADLLDSTNTPGSNNYCAPHAMTHGDLFGPWIWQDLHACCHALRRTIVGYGLGLYGATPPAARYVPAPYAGPGNYGTINSFDVSVSGYPSLASAEAAADALWPPAPSSVGTAGYGTFGSIWTGNPVFGGFFAQEGSFSCQFGSPAVYLGRKGSMETYLLASGFGWDTFFANGTGLVAGQWKLWDTEVLPGTGGDIFGEAITLTIFGGTKPAWETPSSPTATSGAKGMTLLGPLCLIRWDVTGGFNYP